MAALMLATACSAAPTDVTPKAPTAAPKIAPALWETSCRACHGDVSAFRQGKARAGADTMRVIAAGSKAAPWHTFWYLSVAQQRALTTLLTGDADAPRPEPAQHRQLVSGVRSRYRGDVPAPSEDVMMSSVAELRDVPTPLEDAQLLSPETWAQAQLQKPKTPPPGDTLYSSKCAACHTADGKGIPGVFPPLRQVPWTHDPAKARDHIRVVLTGLKGEIEVNGVTYNGVMQGWHPVWDDGQVAAVVSYVNTAWGNQGGAVTIEQVAAERQALGLPPKPYKGSRFVEDRGEAVAFVSNAPCAGCHGKTAPPGSAYFNTPVERFLGALVSGAGGHPPLGRAMHPSALCGMVGLSRSHPVDPTCPDQALRALTQEMPR